MDVSRAQVIAYRVGAHHLDTRLPPDDWLTAARLVGLRTSVPGCAETSLHARVSGVGPELLASALARRRLVEVESHHGGHLVPVDDVPVFTTGVVARGDESIRGRLRRAVPEGWTPSQALDVTYDAALAALAGGPLTTGELSAAITERVPAELSPYCRACGCAHIEPGLFRLAGMRGAYCHETGHGGRSRRLARMDAWLGRPPPTLDVTAAQDALVRRFLRAHGPATARELAEWSAISVTDATERLQRCGGALVPVRYAGRDAVIHGDDVDQLRRAGPVTGVRLLPAYDPLLTTPDRETLAPDPAARADLWRAVGNSGAVLCDGDVVASWRARKVGRRLVASVTPFGPSTSRFGGRARLRREIESELAAVAVLRGCADAAVEVTA